MNWNRPRPKFKMSATISFPAAPLRIGKVDLPGQRQEARTNPIIRMEPMFGRKRFQNDLRLDRGCGPQSGRTARRGSDPQDNFNPQKLS